MTLSITPQTIMPFPQSLVGILDSSLMIQLSLPTCSFITKKNTVHHKPSFLLTHQASRAETRLFHSGCEGGCTISPSPYFVAATSPHVLHRLFSSSAPNSSTTSLTCVPRSVQTKRFSHTTPLQFLQYHRITSTAFSARGCSITTPTVSLKRTGQCGVFAGSRKIEPSWMGISWNVGGVVEVSTVLSSIEPRYW